MSCITELPSFAENQAISILLKARLKYIIIPNNYTRHRGLDSQDATERQLKCDVIQKEHKNRKWPVTETVREQVDQNRALLARVKSRKLEYFDHTSSHAFLDKDTCTPYPVALPPSFPPSIQEGRMRPGGAVPTNMSCEDTSCGRPSGVSPVAFCGRGA